MSNPTNKIEKLSIVIPAYNEGPTIHHILDKVKAVNLLNGIKKELIIVNDCSKDNTEESILAYAKNNPELDIQYRKHEVNKGKGAALHTGIREATGDFIVIQDADLEYDPRDIENVIRPIVAGEADVSYGSRYFYRRSNDRSLLHRWANYALTAASNGWRSAKTARSWVPLLSAPAPIPM